MNYEDVELARRIQAQQLDMPDEYMGSSLAPDFVPPISLNKQQQDSDLIKWQIDGTDLLEVLLHNLKREFFDYENQQWIQVENQPPMLNDKGVYDILSMLQPRLHKILSLTNLESKDVNRMAKEIRNNVIEKLYLNYDLYECQKSDLTTIVNIVDHLVYAVLRKSFNDGQRRHLSEVTQFNKTEHYVNNNTSQNRPSVVGRISRLFGGQ